MAFCFAMASVTILCHDRISGSSSGPNFLAIPSKAIEHTVYGFGLNSADDKPKAHDDEAETLEENPVTFNILANDDADSRDEEKQIDPSSIDLDPDTHEIENAVNVVSGTYTVDHSGNLTFTPAVNFFGRSRIEYTVSDFEGNKSGKAKVTVTVDNVNDAPTITGQTPDPLVAQEDQGVPISLSNLIVSDPDNVYPTGFSLSILPGTNYTVSGNTVTPAPNFTGELLVSVTVSDGAVSSNSFDFKIDVNATNDAPVITGQTPNPLSVNEDNSLTLSLNNLNVSDADNTYPTGFSLQVQPGQNYTVSGTTITPTADFSGNLSVGVTVSDGQATSNTFNVSIIVTAINDAPVITAQNPDPITTGEEQPVTIGVSNLVIADPDNNASDFEVFVSAGPNYTFSGSTVTPAADFSGNLVVPVTVNDGQATSNTFNVNISVAGSNDVPEITGQVPLSVNEDNSITIIPAQLTVTDSDNAFPEDFTIQVGAGNNYSVNGTTVTPNLNYAGTLSIPVTVSDGNSTSNTFSLQITVVPVNDAPIIVSQSSLSTQENTGIDLSLGSFNVTDPDNTYPTGFTLTVLAGDNYTVTNSTVTPASGFSGNLVVPVQVSDGTSSSNIFNAQVEVTAVNDQPTITGQNPITVAEDSPFTIQLSDLQVVDSDNVFPGGFSLRILPGTNYTFTNATVTPTTNFTGALTVNVVVNDGSIDSPPFALQVTVSPVNDAPVITSQQSLSTNEDVPIAISLGSLVVTDPDNTYPTGFSLTLFPGSNYTLDGSNVVPSPNYQGNLSVGAQVSDGAASSNIFQLHITVSNVNDTPVITGQTVVSTAEDVAVSIGLSNLTVMDPDNSYPAGFTLSIGAGPNYAVSGTTITPSQDFNGTLNIPVTVSDGNSTSSPFNFQIQVGDANDPPVIVSQVPLTTNEEQAITIQLANLTVTDPDNTYPGGFSLSLASGPNYTVESSSIVPAENFSGTLTVPVRVNDGVNNSATFNLTIQVNPVNDAPSFAAISNQTTLENSSPPVVNITNISAGPGESDQAVTFSASSSNTSLVSNPVVTYSGGNSATLRYTLAANVSGQSLISVTATDNGPSGSPHQNSYTATFQVNVTEVNLPPTINAISDVSVLEDAQQQSISVAGITAGAGENQTISIEVVADHPELFEVLQPVYTSPAISGSIDLKPAANQFGTALITVRVIDNGSNVAPSVNSVTRTFRVTIQPVNDLPVFTSQPVVVTAVNEPYEYVIEFKDVESPSLSVNAVSKPSWASLTGIAAGKFKLYGTPPPSAAGTTQVDLRIMDSGTPVDQTYTLLVNNRPETKPIQLSTQEDIDLTLSPSSFASSYSDLDQHALAAIQVTQLPVHGTLTVNEQAVVANDTISLAGLSSLKYSPEDDYDGEDAFYWKAFDGYHFSAQAASVEIDLVGVNDAPRITLETDTLSFEVNGVPAFVTEILDIEDPDNDSLSRAEITFVSNYDPEFDILLLETGNGVQGFFDYQLGKIVLTGHAPITAYEDVIKSIQYNHLNTLDPVLKMKTISFTATDDELTSDAKERLIDLKYNFIDLEIPSGFTPNGDMANDIWVITRPGGLDQLEDAVVRVFNRRGIQVFEAHGFQTPWDGTMNGQVLPADTYYFTIDLNLRSKKTYKGTVTLLR